LNDPTHRDVLVVLLERHVLLKDLIPSPKASWDSATGSRWWCVNSTKTMRKK